MDSRRPTLKRRCTAGPRRLSSVRGSSKAGDWALCEGRRRMARPGRGDGHRRGPGLMGHAQKKPSLPDDNLARAAAKNFWSRPSASATRLEIVSRASIRREEYTGGFLSPAPCPDLHPVSAGLGDHLRISRWWPGGPCRLVRPSRVRFPGSAA